MTEDKKSQEKTQEKAFEDFQKRVKSVNEEMIPLLTKHRLILGAIPVYVQNEQGFFMTWAKPQFFDKVSLPVDDKKKETKVETSDIAKVE